MTRDEERHERALAKARNRGEVAKEWFKTHKLTKETFDEFQKLMKKSNREWMIANGG